MNAQFPTHTVALPPALWRQRLALALALARRVRCAEGTRHRRVITWRRTGP